MDLNATLFAQLFWFILFVVFTMKYIWPPLVKNLEARRQTIADGLAAAEKGQRELELAEHKAHKEIDAAKTKAAKIVDQAQQRANQVVEQSKLQARTESDRILELAQQEISQSYKKAEEELRQEVGDMALKIAEKLVQHRLDAEENNKLISGFIKDLSSEQGVKDV